MKKWKIGLTLLKGFSFIGILGTIIYNDHKKIKKERELSRKFNTYYNLLAQWVDNKNNNRNISTYLIKSGIHNIAVYGAGPLGKNLYQELSGTDVKTKFFIDKNVGQSDKDLFGIPVITLECFDKESKSEIEAIIVTPTYFYDDIYNDIYQMGIEDIDIIPLDDIVYDMS